MKKIIFLLLIITLLSCKENNEIPEPISKNSELLTCSKDGASDSAALMLKEFYVKYISAINDQKPYKEDSLVKLYTSAEFYHKLETPVMDADCFIDAQDYCSNWLDDNIYITKISVNNYRINLMGRGECFDREVIVTVKKINEKYYIDNTSAYPHAAYEQYLIDSIPAYDLPE